MTLPDNPAFVSEHVKRDEMRTLRGKQRELVLSGYDENQRTVLMGFIPQNLAMQFLPGHWERPQADNAGFIPLNDFPEFFKTFETQPGETYTLLFELLTTAQTPIEARNIVNVVGALSYLTEPQNRDIAGSQNFANKISQSRYQFLNGTKHPEVSQRVNDVARFFVQKAVSEFSDVDDKMATTRRMLDAYGFGDSGRLMKDHGEYALEAMVAFLLDPHYPYYYRAKLLGLFYKIDFNQQFDGYHKQKAKIFEWNASFWRHVDGSWVGLPTEFTSVIPIADDQAESDEPKPYGVIATDTVQVLADEVISPTFRRRIDYLEKQLADFRTKEGQWGGHMNVTRARIANLEGIVRAEETTSEALTEMVLKQMGEISALQEELQRKGDSETRENIVFGGQSQGGDLLGQFLTGFRLSREEIVSKPLEERTPLVRRLQKIAGMGFHPSTNSANPDEEIMKILNAGLDKLLEG